MPRKISDLFIIRKYCNYCDKMRRVGKLMSSAKLWRRNSPIVHYLVHIGGSRDLENFDLVDFGNLSTQSNAFSNAVKFHFLSKPPLNTMMRNQNLEITVRKPVPFLLKKNISKSVNLKVLRSYGHFRGFSEAFEVS